MEKPPYIPKFEENMGSKRIVTYGGTSVDVRRVLACDPEIEPSTAGPIIRVLLAVTEARVLMGDHRGWGGANPGVALSHLAYDGQLIAEVLYPEFFEERRRHEAESARLAAEWRARERATRKQTITQTLRTAVFERDAYRCRHCGAHRNLAADHIIPEARGGLTVLENLQTLCKSCNSRKHAKMPEG